MYYKDKIISAIANEACQNISGKVIRDLRKMTEGMQSGDDSCLKTIWDEVCVQMKDEQSVMWDAYEETILALIEREVCKLDKAVIGAIWLQTDEGEDWDEDNQDAEENNIIGQNDYNEFYFIQIEPKPKFIENKIPDTVDYSLDDVTKHILNEYVLKLAHEWNNKRIEKYIDEGNRL